MLNDKLTGTYYTPQELIEFMVDYLKKENQDLIHVLEPSAGDGRFLEFLLPLSAKVDAIELFSEKVKDITENYHSDKLSVMQADFIDFALQSKKKYSMVIGNPPYINIKVMDKDTVAKARELCKEAGLSSAIMQNMWLTFVIGACKVLSNTGAIFFVLPMEFLQVQYAEKLRDYLEKKFNTIHIISFNKFIFEGIEQEVCLVYLTNRKVNLPYILYEIYDDAKSRAPQKKNRIEKNKPLKKWSNAILSDSDILLLKKVATRYPTVSKMGVTAPGIVTGGNKYFILPASKVKKMKCEKMVLPIIQKTSLIRDNTIVIDKGIFDNLIEGGKPVYLLNLAKVTEELPEELKEYLKGAGEEKVDDIKLKKRYKCSKRTPWYGVPIVKKGDIIFFKRYDRLPRVYINRLDIHTTDAGYHIQLDDDFDKESVVFCFYNSMTLAQCEFYGRYYGGGVSELVPSEFKQLSIPYYNIEKKDIDSLDNMFRKKVAIDEIVAFVNSKTIAQELSELEIKYLEEIREKLISRRYKG